MKLLPYTGTVLMLLSGAVFSLANIVYWPTTTIPQGDGEDTALCIEEDAIDEQEWQTKIHAVKCRDWPFTLCGYGGLVAEGTVVSLLVTQKTVTPLQWSVLLPSTLLQCGMLAWRVKRARNGG